ARLAAAGEWLVRGPQRGEVRAGAGAVLEDAGLADPQVHDPAFVDEVVLDRLDEARVRGRPLVRRRAPHDLAGRRIDVVVSLRRALDAVRPVQTRVKPLRRVRRRHLHGEHVAQLVMERAGVGYIAEVAAFPTPIGPAARESAKDLSGVRLL